MTALQKPPTRGTQTNVLQHIAGYFKHLLDSSDRRKLHETIESYRSGRAPLADPVALLRRHVRHHAHRHGIAYLAQQSYLTGPLGDAA